MFIVPAELQNSLGVPVSCSAEYEYTDSEEEVMCILQGFFFPFNGLNSFWTHLSYQPMLHLRIKEPFLSVI